MAALTSPYVAPTTARVRRRDGVLQRPKRPRCTFCRRAASRLDTAPCLHHRADAFTSLDGSVVLHAARSHKGVVLTRLDCGEHGLTSSVAMGFSDSHAFESWAQHDPIRFDEPLLLQEVVRHVRGLLESPVVDLQLRLPCSAEAAQHVAELAAGLDRESGAEAAIHLMRRLAAFADCTDACFVSEALDDRAHGRWRWLLLGSTMQRVILALNNSDAVIACPWLRHANHSAWPIAATELTAVDPKEQAFMSMVLEEGFEASMVIPAPTPSIERRTAVLVLGLAASDRRSLALQSLQWALAHTVALALSHWTSRVVGAGLSKQCRLTDEDQTLLRLQRDGLSSKEMARRLALSTEAVDSRFQRICAKTRTLNRRRALDMLTAYGGMRAPDGTPALAFGGQDFEQRSDRSLEVINEQRNGSTPAHRVRRCRSS